MTTRHSARWHSACFLAVACLMAMLAIVSPEAAAQPSARCYERMFSYPHPVPPLIETLAAAEWRQRTMGVPEAEPAEEMESRNPPLGLRAGTARLMPGVKQSEVVVPASGSLPVHALELLPVAPRAPSPAPDLKFDGIGYTGFVPPDDAIAAGPTHLVCAVNRYIQVRTLSGAVISTISFTNFFPTEPTRAGADPRVVYDAATGRFIFIAIGRRTSPPTSTCMVAVSATSDPTGLWFKYVLDVGRNGTPPTEWADFPSLGYDGTAIYITFNMHNFSQNQFRGNRLLILDKSQALSGQALTATRIIDNLTLPTPPFVTGLVNFDLKPAEVVGSLTPYPILGIAGLFGLTLYSITDPLGTSGGPSIQASFIDTNDFELAADAPQAGTTFPLNILTPSIETAVYRDGVLWACQVVSSTGARGGKAQVNLYKLSPAAGGFLLDMKSITDPIRAFYYPAIVPDAFGDAIVLFNGSDLTSFASVYVARFNAATGQMDTPTLVDAGQSPFVVVDSFGRVRWGDYQDASLDVVTGTHVWVQGMIPIASELWQMKIAHVAASPPAPPSGLTVTPVSPTRIDLVWIDNSLGESGFKIERKNGDGVFVLLAIVGPNVTRYSDTSVIPGISYTYRVRSFNGAGDSAPTSEAAATAPDQGVGVGVAALLLAPTPIPGGTTIIGIVALDGPAPGVVTVTLSSSNPAVANPAVTSLVLPPGTITVPFLVNTSPVTATTFVTITAAVNGSSKSAILEVRP